MEEEIWNQAEEIPKFASQLRSLPFPRLEPSRLIFAGSGDSYAAAIFAQELSLGEAAASDPYELLRSIRRVRGKDLVIVSISGKTRANVELARRAKGGARKRFAITANPDSPLAHECDETLPLQYRKAETLTAGTISFTISLLACAAVLGQLPRTVNVRPALRRASQWAKSLGALGTGSFVFVGSSVNHALSIYGAAKVREVLGEKAEAEYPEQLGHSRMFAIDKKYDTVICLSCGQDRALHVHKLLDENGLRTKLLTIAGDNIVQTSLEVVLHLQQLGLALARKRGIKECAFLADPRTLNLSSKMIY